MNSSGAGTAHRNSVSARLRRGIAGTLMLSSALTFAALYIVGRNDRVSTFEEALADDLRAISNVTVVHPDGDLYVNIEPEVMDVYLEGGKRFFQLWEARDLELLDRSPSLKSLGHTFPPPPHVADGRRRWEARLPDGRVVSLLSATVYANWAVDSEKWLAKGEPPLMTRPVHLMVGRPRDELDRSLAPLAWACLAGAIVLPLLASLTLMRLVPRALAPLRDLGEAVSARSSDDMRPIEQCGMLEIDPIVLRLNDLLARIAEARRRERAFIAHVAHELRTPLAEMLAVADVAELDGDVLEVQSEAVADMRHAAARMARLVDALFCLARHDRERPQARGEPLELQPILAAALAGQRGDSEDRGLRWSVAALQDVQVRSDPVLLRALLDNLIANAIAHAPERSQVRVEISDMGTPFLRMANAVDPANRPHGDHLGHGLVIARLYAQALNVALTLQRDERTFEVGLAWPA